MLLAYYFKEPDDEGAGREIRETIHLLWTNSKGPLNGIYYLEII